MGRIIGDDQNSIDETDPLEKEFYDLVVKARKVYTGWKEKERRISSFTQS
jgi:hypothetical protein